MDGFQAVDVDDRVKFVSEPHNNKWFNPLGKGCSLTSLHRCVRVLPLTKFSPKSLLFFYPGLFTTVSLLTWLRAPREVLSSVLEEWWFRNGCLLLTYSLPTTMVILLPVRAHDCGHVHGHSRHKQLFWCAWSRNDERDVAWIQCCCKELDSLVLGLFILFNI